MSTSGAAEDHCRQGQGIRSRRRTRREGIPIAVRGAMLSFLRRFQAHFRARRPRINLPVWRCDRTFRRGNLLFPFLVSLPLLAVASPARADGRSLRLGMSGGIGLLVAPGHGSIQAPTGGSQDFFSCGFGLDLRLGAQLGRHVALDAQVFGETMLLGGDMRAAGLLEIAPVPQFAFSLCGGVGTMFIASLFSSSPSADFASGLVRLEGRLENANEASSPDRQTIPVFGFEGQLGYVFRGSIPEGSLLVGPRLFGGFLWH